MKGFTRWRDTEAYKRTVEDAGGIEAFKEASRRMLDEARGWRLAELRKDRDLTQAQVAERMGVTKGRISQIENGQVSGQEVIARYVEALGGHLITAAIFDDGELRQVG